MICRSSYKILWPNKADDAVDQKRFEYARDAIGPRFERELIDAVMRFRRQRAALASLEIHHVIAAHEVHVRGRWFSSTRSRPSRSMRRVMPKLALAAWVPAMD